MTDEERRYLQLKRWAKRLDMNLFRFRGKYLLVDPETKAIIGEFSSLDQVCDHFESVRWSPC